MMGYLRGAKITQTLLISASIALGFLVLIGYLYMNVGPKPQSSGLSFSYPEEGRLRDTLSISVGFRIADFEAEFRKAGLQVLQLEQDIVSVCQGKMEASGKLENIQLSRFQDIKIFYDHPLHLGIVFYIQKNNNNASLAEIQYSISRTSMAEVVTKIRQNTLSRLALDKMLSSYSSQMLQPIEGERLPMIVPVEGFSPLQSKETLQSVIVNQVEYLCSQLGKEIQPNVKSSIDFEKDILEISVSAGSK